MPGTGCGLTNLRHETDEEPGILTDGTGDQVFNVLKNDAKAYPQAVRAVVETSGQILTYKGSLLLDSPYGASNKGCTVAYKNYPYLVERPDPWDAVESKRRRDLGLSVKALTDKQRVDVMWEFLGLDE